MSDQHTEEEFYSRATLTKDRPYEVGEVATDEWLRRVRRQRHLERMQPFRAKARAARLALDDWSELLAALDRYRADPFFDPHFAKNFKDRYDLRRHLRAQTEQLTDYADIKRWRAGGESHAVIAERFDGHSPYDPLTHTYRPGVTAADIVVIETMGGKPLRSELTESQPYDLREEIGKRHQAGESLRDLAEAFGVGKSTIQRWCEK